MAKTLKK